MDIVTWIVIIFCLVVVGSIVRWVFFWYRIYKLVRHWEANLGNAESMLRTYQQAPAQARQTMNPQVQAMLMRVQSQYGDLNRLNQERYDLRVSELQGMAAQAGFDWSPPS